jgi:hypothetical protein
MRTAYYRREVTSAGKADFVRVDGSRLYAGSEELRLRGVLFDFGRSMPTPADYADIARMGLNAVTLPFSYRPFYGPAASETARGEVWKWIDRHVALAGQHGIRLILQLAGVEGAQFVPDTELPYDYRIWRDPALQESTAGVWRTVAAHYRDEPTIAGLSLFQEPVCAGTVDEWRDLARSLAAAIREVDENHTLFVDRAYGEHELRREVSGVELPAERAFPLLDDDNVVYEFYFFERDEYTHQFAPWRPEPDLRRRRTYPDREAVVEYREADGPPQGFAFDRGYLEHHLARQLELRRVHQVPMSVWGFGLNRDCFGDGRGGMRWLLDCLQLFEEAELNWILVAYADEYFGIRGNVQCTSALRGLSARPARGRIG